MFITNREMTALEGLAFTKYFDTRVQVEKWDGKFRHYAFRVTKDGRIMTRYGELKWANVQTIDGDSPLVTFGARDFVEYKVSTIKVED